MQAWQTFKTGYYRWEDASAKLIERFFRSPLLLRPVSSAISELSGAFGKHRNWRDACIARLGLPTRREQEQCLYLLDSMYSKILDLEERLGNGVGPAVLAEAQDLGPAVPEAIASDTES